VQRQDALGKPSSSEILSYVLLIPHQTNLTLPELTSAFNSIPPAFADVWMSLMMRCNGWSVPSAHSPSHPTHHLDHPGHPWAATGAHNTKKESQISTAFPLLFLSTTLDPVTPLSSAVKMARRFKDAGLMEQLSEGHCTISSASRCTARVVREYFVNGKVPPPPTEKDDGDDGNGNAGEGRWVKCGADELPWGLRGDSGEEGSLDAEGDGEVMEGLREMQRVLGEVQRWGVGGKSHSRGGVGVDWEAVMALTR
jgi:hypothetical protein